jgi:pre-rRNA-processing protein TSR1
LKKAATSFLSAELPEDCKYYLADTKDDLHKVNVLFNIPVKQNSLPFTFFSFKFSLLIKVLIIVQFMWLFKEQHLSSPHWRTQRPYVMSEKVLIAFALLSCMVANYMLSRCKNLQKELNWYLS